MPIVPETRAAPPGSLDLAANRRASKYSPREQLLRVLWGFGRLAFRFSPRPAHGWRRTLLRLFGAEVGAEAHLSNTARICMPWKFAIGAWSAVGDRALVYNLGFVRLGERVTVSQGAHLCAGSHDHTDPAMPLLKPPITVEDQAWVCTDAFVGPGVTVGEGAVAGARAVIVKDVPAWMVVAGNPASIVQRRRLGS